MKDRVDVDVELESLAEQQFRILDELRQEFLDVRQTYIEYLPNRKAEDYDVLAIRCLKDSYNGGK